MTRSTFLLPALLGLATPAGLVIALTGDGWRQIPSWIGLGLPVLAVAWARARRRRHPLSHRGIRPQPLDRTIIS